MKKHFNLLAVAIMGALMVVSCGKKLKTNENGLLYRFDEVNKNGQMVQEGDLLVGTLVIRLDDSVLISADTTTQLFMVDRPNFKGDLPEGLLMMHVGDRATFGIEADSLHKLGLNFPPFYKAGTGMKLYYEINLEGIITKDSIIKLQMQMEQEYMKMIEAEKETLANYVKEHNLKGTPDEDGLYIIVNKKGNGNKVEINRQVEINYTGRLIDGTVFDSSNEQVAKDNNVYDQRRPYGPMAYVVGAQSFIPGWEKGVINQTAGSKLTLIIPSKMAYGQRSVGQIPANSPLIFDIEIVSVK